MLGKRRVRSQPAYGRSPPAQPPAGSRRVAAAGGAGGAATAARSTRGRLHADGDEEAAEDELESESEEEEDGEAGDEEAEEEDGETPDEKRVRLTQLYLRSIKQAGNKQQQEGTRRRGGEAGEGSEAAVAGDHAEDEDEDEDVDSQDEEMEDVVSHRLHADLASHHGQRHTSSLASLVPLSHHSVRSLRGHRLSVTCTALSHDEQRAYSGSKDGSIIEWDVETGHRRVQWPGSGQAAVSGQGGSASKKRHGLLALTASSNGRLLASAGQDGSIRVWDIRSRQETAAVAAAGGRASTRPLAIPSSSSSSSSSGGSSSHIMSNGASASSPHLTAPSAVAPRLPRLARVLHSCPPLWCEWTSAHRSTVSALSFRLGSDELFSASHDRTVKLFDCGSKAYMETLFGHTAEVQDVHCLYRNRAVSAASDRTARLWKVVEESQLLFRVDTQQQPVATDHNSTGSSSGSGSSLSLDCCRQLDDDHFLTGGDDGSVALWNINKKKPMHVHGQAHLGAWVVSLGVCPFSDLAFSGSSDGHINVYQCNTASTSHYHARNNGTAAVGAADKAGKRPDALQLVSRIACVGYVNSLSCAASGRFLVAGLGQEHRAGRWTDNVKAVRNGVSIIQLAAQPAR